jgi:hypothetical protein
MKIAEVMIARTTLSPFLVTIGGLYPSMIWHTVETNLIDCFTFQHPWSVKMFPPVSKVALFRWRTDKSFFGQNNGSKPATIYTTGI